MSAGIELYNDVLNQLGSPALYSDIFANRPAFGYTGRLFISTDTLEIYRDTGTAWQLLSSGGGGVNIYNSNGSLTAARTMTMAGFSLTFSGGASAATLNVNANNNVNREIKYQTGGVDRWQWLVSGNETGSNSGSDLSLRAYNDVGTYINPALTIRRGTSKFEMYSNDALTSGGSVGYVGYYMSGQATYVGALSITGNPQGSIYNIFTFTNNGSPTFAASNVVSSLSNVTRISGGNGTVTLTQAAGSVRAMSNVASLTQYNLINNVTVTHYAGINALGVDDIATTGGILTLTNAYQLLINSLDEYGEVGVGTLVLTNRWGIYQSAALDSNYLNGNTLIGSTTSTGEKLQVTGTARVTQSAYFATASGSVGIGTTSPIAPLHVFPSTNDMQQVWGNYNPAGVFAYMRLHRSTSDGTFTFGTAQNGFSSIAFATSSASNEAFTERMRITSGGNVLIGKTSDDGALLQLNDAGNISFGTTTGTKIGTSTSQKLSFYNTTPIVQPTTAVGSATYASPGAGSTVKTDDTFDGYTLQQVVKALRNLGILA